MSTPFDAAAADAASRCAIPLDLLRAVISHESNWNPLAIGDGGNALGLMQVHPDAATDVGKSWYLLRSAIWNKDTDTAAKLGIDIGAAYFAKMLHQFKDPAWALAAYNQGPTVIAKAKAYADAVLSLMPSKPEGKTS